MAAQKNCFRCFLDNIHFLAKRSTFAYSMFRGPTFITGDGKKNGTLQSNPKGSKKDQMVNLSVFDHLGPFWAHLDPFGPFQTRIDILLRSTSANPYFVHLGQKNHFCLKWFKRVQMGRKGVPNGQKHLDWSFCSFSDSLRPLWSVDKPAMFGSFWSKMDHL